MSKRSNKPGDDTDDSLVTRANELFNDSVQNIDGETRSRLNRRRQQALEAAATKPLLGTWNVWAPAGAAAAIAMLALVMWSGQELPTNSVAPTAASDFEMLLEQDSLEMLEDLEFYSWMDSEEIDGMDAHVG